MGTTNSKVGASELPQPRDDNPWTKEPLPDEEGPKLPLPAPPTTSKVEIFNRDLFENIDKHASELLPKYMNASYEELAYHLTKTSRSDLERVRAIYTWITSNDPSELLTAARATPKEGSPLEYISKIKKMKGNKAYLFSYLCLAAGVPCVLIGGINKSSAYKVGSSLDRGLLAAQWNAVLVDNQWRLVDTFWGSTCTSVDTTKDWTLLKDKEDQEEKTDQEVAPSTVIDVDYQEEHAANEFFFLTDPKMLASTHLPNDEKWQMMEKTISFEKFEKQAYLRERFFDLDARLIEKSLHKCVNKAKKGEINIVFGVPSVDSQYLQFTYLIYMERGQAPPDDFPLKRYVLYEKRAESVHFNVQFPVDGRYKVDIFGKHKIQYGAMELVATYVVDAVAKRDAQPLPDEPEIGWGAGLEMEEKGLSTDQKEAVIETTDGLVELRFNKTNPLSVLQAMRHNNLQDYLLQRVSVLWEDGDDVVVSIRLPEAGHYGFKLYADDPNSEGELENICNFLLKSINPNATPTLFPELYGWVLGKGRHAEELGVKAGSHTGSHVQTEDGKLSLTFEHPPDVELMLQLTSNKFDPKLLAESITRIEEDGKTTFEIDLPDAGEFGINVYGQKREGKSSAIHHVHSCLLQSNQSTRRVTPAEVLHQVGPQEEKQTVETFRRAEKVPQPPAPSSLPLVATLQRQQAQDPLDHMAVETVNGEDDLPAFKLKLPEVGRYDLDVYEKWPSGALLGVPGGLTVDRREPRPGELEADKKKNKESAGQEDGDDKLIAQKYGGDLRALRAAVKSLDPDGIQKALDAIRSKGEVPESLQTEISEAENLMNEYRKHKTALSQAMEKGSIDALEKALKAVEKAHPAVRKKLDYEIRAANERLQRLRRIERHRHNILKLKKTTIAEIRAYSTPPDAVYSVMRATFTILGDPESETKDWNSLRALIGKTGEKNLLRRVRMYEVSAMTREIHGKCQKMMSGLDINIVRDVSVGAAAFYVWTSGMMEAAEENWV